VSVHDADLLLTGATGFLGGAVLRRAVAEGRRVVVLARHARPTQLPAFVSWHHGTPEDAALVRTLVDATRPRVLVHAAGAASVAGSLVMPAEDYAGSVSLTRGVLEGVRQSGHAPRVLLLGSAAVYGNPASLPVSETAPVAPISPYGWHRHLCEDLAALYRQSFDVDVVIGRIFSAYGPGLRRQVVFDAFTRLADAAERATASFSGTGDETRDFLHVDDVARALLLVAEFAPAPVVNIASGQSVSLREVTGAIAERVGGGRRVQFDGTVRPGDPRCWEADVARLRSTGFVPRVTLAEGLDSVWETMRPTSQRVASSPALIRPAPAPEDAPVGQRIQRVALRLVGDAQWHGGVQYLINLLEALRALPAAERPEIWLQADARNRASLPFFLPLSPHVAGLVWVGDDAPADVQALFASGQARHLSTAAELGQQFDAVFPVLSKAWPECASAISWIPDLQHRHLPALFSEKERTGRDAAFFDVTRRSAACVVSSEAAQRDLAAFDPGATARTWVLRFRASLPYDASPARVPEVLATYGVTGPYLMCINQFWVHKDHATLFQALAVLARTGEVPHVLCTGAMKDYRHPGHGDAMLALVQQLGLAHHVRFLGHVPREDQAQLLRGASGVIQPSRFEGWSTVLEDARALGLPVLASDLAVHLEQSPFGMRTFRTGDAADLARALREHWPQWRRTPAASLTTEATARAQATADQQHFARTFLRIASEFAAARQPKAEAAVPDVLEVLGDFRSAAATRATLQALARALGEHGIAAGARRVILHGPGVERLPDDVFSASLIRGFNEPPPHTPARRLAS
jgi:nucleoside-diphosphate-sugar epimerase